jgi:hypothetical protein
MLGSAQRLGMIASACQHYSVSGNDTGREVGTTLVGKREQHYSVTGNDRCNMQQGMKHATCSHTTTSEGTSRPYTAELRCVPHLLDFRRLLVERLLPNRDELVRERDQNLKTKQPLCARGIGI